MRVKLIGIFLIGLLLGGTLVFMNLNPKSQGYIPYFKIVGDVEAVISVRNMNDYAQEMETINYKDETIQCIPLAELMRKAIPQTEDSTVQFVGTDGLSSRIDLSTIQKSYICFSEEHGWHVINLEHPISSNIKHIAEMIVASKDTQSEFGIQIFSDKENIKNITCGQMAQSEYLLKRTFEGTSQITVEDRTNEVTVYTPSKLISVSELLPESEADTYVIFSRDGKQTRFSTAGYLKINDNTVDYVPINANENINDIVGIYCGSKISTVSDTFYDTEYYLNNDEKVMIILLDGFSYEQWRYCGENAYSPFLSSTGEAKKVLSAYKPVTNTGMATMITGHTPDVHGVHDRSVRDLNCESIFNIALKQNKKACLFEGDVKILNTEISPILNIDKNKDGHIDDEVLDSAQKQMSDQDLCFVHFHGIDDLGHTYGPFAKETLAYITEVDDYVKTLVSQWDGTTIITADHGMHATPTGGNHGSCRYEDMIIPYITIRQ